MIDFENADFLKLKEVDNDTYAQRDQTPRAQYAF